MKEFRKNLTLNLCIFLFTLKTPMPDLPTARQLEERLERATWFYQPDTVFDKQVDTMAHRILDDVDILLKNYVADLMIGGLIKDVKTSDT